MNMRPLMLSLAALAAAAAVAFAPSSSRASGCTITWVGDVSNVWNANTGGNTNWDDDTLPGAADHACIDSGAVLLTADAQVDHYSIGSGASLTITGARLRATASSTNAGTITLNGGGARLSTEDGVAGTVETLTNTGTIVAGGTGGEQEIAGDLANPGTLTASHELVRFRSSLDGRGPKLTVTGQLTAATGGKLVATGSTLRLPSSGTVSGPGTVDVDTSARLEVAGGTIAASADLNATGGSGNCCGNAPGGALVFDSATGAAGTIGVSSALGGRHAISGTVPTGISIEIESTGIVTAGADWTNAGTIRLLAATSELYTENGVNTDVETLTNTGTLITSGKIGGDVASSGTISGRSPTASFVRADGNRQSRLVNTGTLGATAGNALAFNATTLVLQPGATIVGPGAIDVETGGRLEIAGGTIDPGADLDAQGGSGNCCGNQPGAELAFTGAGATGTVEVTGALGGRHALTGNVPAGITIQLGAAGVLVAAADWTNAGTIRLSGSNAELLTENGVNTNAETLTNTGTIIAEGTGDSRRIGGDLVNSGTLSARHPNTLFPRIDGNRQGKLTNTGALGATAGNRLGLPGTTLRLDPGGSVTGPGTIDVDTGGRLEVAGGTIDPSADLNAAGGSGNCCGNAPGAQLALLSPNLTGRIGVTSALGGTHALTGDIPAGLTLDLSSRLVAAGPLTNAGTVRLAGGFLTVPPADTLTNLGTISGGGTLAGNVRNVGELDGMTVTGTFTQTPEGRLVVAASNNAATTLSVSGAATLDGELAIETTAPPPDPGVDQTAVSTPSRSGTFSNVAGRASGPWAVLYQSPGVVLRGVAPGEFVGGPELTIEDASILEGDSGTANLTFTARLGQAPGHPVTVEWHTEDDTATSPSDFIFSSGLLSFGAAETTKTLTVPVKGDTEVEPGETFRVRLRGARGAGLGVARATGLIIADDLGITAATPNRAGAGPVTMTVLGGGFVAGTTMALVRPGQEDEAGTLRFRDAGGGRLVATFDLAGEPVGVLDLRVTAPGGATATRLGALTLERPEAGQLAVSVTGPEAVRFGFSAGGLVSMHNTGNVDAEIELLRLTATNVTLRVQGQPAFVAAPINLEPDALGPLLGGSAVVPAGETRSFGVRFRSTNPVAHAPLIINAEALTKAFLSRAVTGPVDVLPGGRISGRVVTPGGLGVPGVVISAVAPSATSPKGIAAMTGADGEFAFSGLPDGAYVVAPGSEPTAVERPKRVVVAPSARTPTVTLTEPIADVAGTVRAAGGARLGGARVSLLAGEDLLDSVTADGQGAFAFAVLRPGTYTLMAVHDDGIAVLENVAVATGVSRTGLRLEAGARSITVDTGAPGTDVSLSVAGLADDGVQRLTVADGKVAFNGLPGRPLALLAERDGAETKRASVTPGPGGNAVTMTLGPEARISGTVSGPVTDLRGALVTVAETGTNRGRISTVRRNGAYSVGQLAAGTYDVWVSAPGLAAVRTSGVSVGAGGSQTADVSLAAGGVEQQVTVASPGGGLVTAALISVSDAATGVAVLTTVTDRLGIGRLGPLAPGSYRVRVEVPGALPFTRELTIGGSTPAPIAYPAATPAVVPAPHPRGSAFDAPAPRAGVPAAAARRGLLDTINFPEPVRDPYHGLGSYDHELLPAKNCEEAQRLRDLHRAKRRLVESAFQAWYQTWQSIGNENFADVGLIGAKSLEFVLKGSVAASGLAKIPQGIGFAKLAGANLLIGLLGTGAQANLEEQPPTEAANLVEVGDRIQDALEAFATLDSSFSSEGLKAAGTIAALSVAKDGIKIKLEANQFNDSLEGRAERYGAAETSYRNLLIQIIRLAGQYKLIDCDNPKPKLPPGPSGSYTGDSRVSNDPNDIAGPSGVGAEGWIDSDQDFPYTIRFENLATATAPAVLVRVTHQLDADVDLDRFTLGDLGFGDVTVEVPAGVQSFHDDLTLANGDLVRIDASLERATRTVRWTIQSINPQTGELEESPTAGFLPPENGTGRGNGFVAYRVRPTAGLAEGAEITARASIVFDFNAAIETNLHRNTIDAGLPASAVTSVAAPAGACLDALDVAWSGTDAGSGIGVYDIWVSRDDAPFVAWLTGTAAMSGRFEGAAGHDYAFYSVARDRVGHVEAAPAQGDRSARIGCDRSPPRTLATITGATPVNGFYPAPVMVVLEGIDTAGGTGVNRVTWMATGAAAGGATVEADTTTVPVAADGETVLEASSRDVAGNESGARKLTLKVDGNTPVVTITSPAEGARLPAGSAATAAFACSDAGSGIESCAGSIANGAALDTAAAGAKTLKVTAVDKLGRQTEVTRNYTVVGPGSGQKLSAKPVTLKLRRPNRKGVAKLTVINNERFPIVVGNRVLAAKKPKPLTKAARRLTLGARKAATIKLKFKTVVKKGRKLKARVEAVVTGPAGDKRTVRVKVTVKGWDPKKK